MQVLIAGCDGEFLDIARRFLNQRGHEALVVSSGLECIACLRDCPPDVLVLSCELLWGGAEGVLEIMDEEPTLNAIPVILVMDQEMESKTCFEADSRVVDRVKRQYSLMQLLKQMQLCESNAREALHKQGTSRFEQNVFVKSLNGMTQLQKQMARHWHAESAESCVAALDSSESGLSAEEVNRRQYHFGLNVLPEKGPTPLWTIVLRQFISPLIYILVAAAVVSAMIGDLKDAIFIGVVLLLNTIIGAYQEWQAEQSSHALKKLLSMHAHVERDGEVREVKAEEVVPGDVLWLESGNRVPADIRLLSSQGLEVDESLLTGESLAVRKDFSWIGEAAATLADRQNMTFAGSLVARGRARGIVVATGTATNVGQLALDVMGSGGGKPPLLERMERFTNYVAVGTLIAAAGIGLLGSVLWGYTLVEAFFFDCTGRSCHS